jgi:AcrR family transcriptional regulator
MSKQSTSAPSSTAVVLALPTKQARAQKTRDSLLKAGTLLLKHNSLDNISIAQIAREAGCSVGVFYFRFQDKEAYFRFLLDNTLADIRTATNAAFAPEKIRGTDHDAMVTTCVRHFIGIMRDQQGLLRAAQKQTGDLADSWQPVREMGAWLIDRYVAAIAVSQGVDITETLQRNGRAAFQIVSGVLVNAVLNRPANMNLDSPDLEFWLLQVVSQCLSVSQAPGLLNKKSVNRRKLA